MSIVALVALLVKLGMGGVNGTIAVVSSLRPSENGKAIVWRVINSQGAEHTQGKNYVGYGPQSC